MALRHFGIFRDVTPEQAKLDKTAVKTLFRWGSLQASVLASRCHANVASDEWRGCASRLAAYDLAEEYDRRGTAFWRLKDNGRAWGMDLCCEEQQVQPHDIPGSEAEAFSKRIAAERGAK